MDKLIGELGVIVSGLLGLALVSVLVSRNATTGSLIGASSRGLATDIIAATAPVSGAAGITAFGSGFNNIY